MLSFGASIAGAALFVSAGIALALRASRLTQIQGANGETEWSWNLWLVKAF